MSSNKVPITYRLMKSGEEAAVVDLVSNVFNEFVAPTYSKEGVTEFMKFANTEAMAKRFKAGNMVLLAQSGKKIIGVIEIVGSSHVALFFVTNSFQQMGIGTELMQRAVEICKTKKPSIHRMTVNSSPNAFSVYQKIGFLKMGDEKVIKGIRYIPMWLDLKK